MCGVAVRWGICNGLPHSLLAGFLRGTCSKRSWSPSGQDLIKYDIIGAEQCM